MSQDQSMETNFTAASPRLIDAMVRSGQKSTFTAYLLWFFIGGLGVHNFYLGKPVLGGLQLGSTVVLIFARSVGGPMVLLGFAAMIGLFISLLVDMFLIPMRARAYSDRMRQSLMDSTNWRDD